MRCPYCNKRIYRIQRGEYFCDNDDCPLVKRNRKLVARPEFYGQSQEEVNRFAFLSCPDIDLEKILKKKRSDKLKGDKK